MVMVIHGQPAFVFDFLLAEPYGRAFIFDFLLAEPYGNGKRPNKMEMVKNRNGFAVIPIVSVFTLFF